MAVKPVVRINVDDSQFKAFFQNFQKYDALLKTQVATWNQVNAAMANSSKSLIPNFMTLGGLTKTIAQNLESAFRSLRNLSGLGAIAGLAGFGGSLFGINALANAASAFQRQSGGLGTTTGDMLAFRLNNERYVNPDSLLEKAADAKSDVTKRVPMQFLGVSDFNKDPSQIAYEAMVGMRNAYQRYGGNTNILDSLGLNELFSHDEMRRLGTSGPGELERQHRQEELDRKKLALSREEAMAWQDLKTRLGVAGDSIEMTFIRGLLPLAGPLTELSTRFNDLVSVFLKSPVVEEAITGLARGLHDLSDYMQTKQFKTDVNDILTDLKLFGEGVKHTYEWIMGFLPDANKKADDAWLPEWARNIPILGPLLQATANAGQKTGAFLGNETFKEGQKIGEHLGNYLTTPPAPGSFPGGAEKFFPDESKNRLPYGLLWDIEGAESSHNTDPSARVENKDGSLGPFQNSADEARRYGFSLADRADELKGAAMTARTIREYADMFGGDVAKGVAAYNEGPENLRAQIARAVKEGHADAWRDYLPKGTNKNGYAYDVNAYVNKAMVGVKVENNTGGSANVTVRSLGSNSVGSPAVPQ